MHAPQWTARSERSHMPVVRLMVWITLRLGRRISRIVLHGIALYFLLFAPAARSGLQCFYQRLWGRKANWRELYAHILAFSTVLHDRVFLYKGQLDMFHVDIEGEALLQAASGHERGVVVLGAHTGSFEILRTLGEARHGLRLHMLMYEENSNKINQLRTIIDPQAQRSVIGLNRADSMLRARDCVEAGHWLGMLADRSFARDPTVTLPFLGAPAAFPTGPLRLAAMLRCRVIFLAGVHVRGTRYHVRAVPIADFGCCEPSGRDALVQQAQQAYVDELEALCRSHPRNWFNFYDFWRLPDAQAPAP